MLILVPMHPDDHTPAAHLPAPLPSPAALLHRTQAALGLLRDVVQESSAEYWYERGKAAMKREGWESAAYDFEQCLQKDKSHWRAALQLAVALAQQNQGDAAAAALITAFELPYEVWWKFEHEIEHDGIGFHDNWYILKKSLCYAKHETQGFSPWRLLSALEAANHPRYDIFKLFISLAIVFRVFDSMYAEHTARVIESRFIVVS